jgi:Zn-finger nucleic acid-binding protein
MQNHNGNCPACNIKMHLVKVSSTYDANIFLQQCKSCGGLWSNDMDVYRVKIGEAKNIEDVDAEKLRQRIIFAQQSLRCPNDQQELIEYKDSNFPKNLHIESCTKCGGFWFNRGEFSEFQEQRKKLLEKHKPIMPEISAEDKQLNAQIQTLLATQSTAGVDTIGSIGAFLSTPINPMTNRPFDTHSQDGRNAQEAINVATGIVQIILRCMLPR